MRVCNSEIISKIENYISGHREEILSDLMDLVRIPSVRSTPKEGMPFGEDCYKMLISVKQLFEKNGFESVLGKGNEYEISYYGNKNAKEIGILSHTDVVPVVMDEWIVCKPFEPVIKDGYMFGRGCNDDKSGVVIALYTAKILRDLDIPLKNRLVMINGSAEETGMEDMAAFSANERMPDVSLVPDAVFPCYTGEKNMLRLDLVTKESLKQIKRFDGGMAFNVILEKLDTEIEYSQALYQEILEKSKGDECFSVSADEKRILIKAKGVTRHGAYPEGSVNAAWLTSGLLQDCKELCEGDRSIMKELHIYLTKYYGEGLGIEYEDKVFGKLTSSNGIVRLTHDGKISATLDIRAGCECDMHAVAEKIRTRVHKGWTVNVLESTDGYNIEDDNPIKLALEETYGVLSGRPGVKGEKCSGGTYSRAIKNAISVGSVEDNNIPPLKISLPDGHLGVHQPDETLSVDGFLQALKIIVCMVLEIDAII